MSLPITTRARGTNDGILDAKLAKFFESAKKEDEKLQLRDTVERIAHYLNSPIKLVSRAEAQAQGYGRKKGWTDRYTMEITIVGENHRDVCDIASTAIHETVAHRGLRLLFGTLERFNHALDEMYAASGKAIRDKIDRIAERLTDARVASLMEKKRKAHEVAGEDIESHYFTDLAAAAAKRQQI